MEPGAAILAAILIVASYLARLDPVRRPGGPRTGGPDPRSQGSGRTAARTPCGHWGGVARWSWLLGDVLKGAVPVPRGAAADRRGAVEVACGIAAVLGANRSIFLGFGGGRGVGTGVGTMLVIFPLAVFLATPVFVIVILITRYVSLGSLLGSAAMVVVVVAWWLFANSSVPLAYPLYTTIGCALIWLAHADNIERLLHGTERKFDLGLLGRDDPAGRRAASRGPRRSAPGRHGCRPPRRRSARRPGD